MAKLLSGTRVYGNAIVDTILTINGNIAANSTTTGSLQVKGGASVLGNIYLTGNVVGNVSGGVVSATIASSIPYTLIPAKPAINLLYTGDVTGSGNVNLVNIGTNSLSLAMTLANTGVVANTYGNAKIIPVITVDSKGRITSASNVAQQLLYSELLNAPAVNVALTGDVVGSANAVLTAGSTVLSITTTVQANSVALGTDTTGNYTDRILSGSGISVSGTGDEGNVITVAVNTTTLDSRYLQLSTASQQTITGPLRFEGNIIFDGNVATVSANNLIIEDNFIYLNNQSVNTNPDFGFAGNYNDGTYRHAGFFRDASDDGIWKVFDQYLPEPDAQVNIDTNNASFRLANFAANIVYTNRINVTSSAVVVNLNADLLDGQDSTYFINYNNLVNKPAANISLTGNVTGSANTLLTGNSTVISIAATLENTGVTAGTYGNAKIIPVITVDSTGRITSASNVALSGVGSSSDTQLLYNSSGAVVGSTSLTFDGTNLRTPYLLATNSSGDEGGEIQLAKPAANASYTGNIVIDAYQNKIRIFEQGGTNRGVYIDLTAANAGVATNLLSGGGTSDYTTLTNKPSVNVTFTGDVTGSGNVALSSGSTNLLSVALTVQPNSVALGTDTTGNYTDRVAAGTGITVSGTADEGNVITVGLTTTGVSATTYGSSTVTPIVTVDTYGRITSAANASIAFPVISVGSFTGAVSNTNLLSSILAVDGSGSGLDADLLDGQDSTYYVNYNNQVNKPAANVVLTGDVSGTANVLLTANSTVISIATTIQPNSVALGTDTTGNYTDRILSGSGITVSGTGDEGNVITVAVNTTTLDSRYLQLSTASQQTVTGPLRFEGNVTFDGNVTTLSANNLVVEDNFIYLNNQSVNTNPDFGFVGNYNDGTYRHAGFFRDASDDGTWKVFDQYLPEPDSQVNIDTNNASFRLASFAANVVYTNRINVTSTALVVNLNADQLDGQDSTYFINYNNLVNKPVANIALTGNVTGSANTLLTGNSTVISISATLENTGVTAGTYGNAKIIPVITVDSKGRITSVSNVTQQVLYSELVNAPAVNVALTGDVTGSANAVLTAGSTVLSISTTIQPNSVALGTDTTGNYTDRVAPGTGITVTGTADEGNVITVALASSGVVASTYGNATTAAIFTIDSTGRVTSASNSTINATRITAADDTTSATLYPVMVSATGSAQTPSTTSTKITYNAATGTLNLLDNPIFRARMLDYSVNVNALGTVTGTATANLELGNYVSATASGAVSWTFSNPPASGVAGGFILELANGGSGTQTWPPSVTKWPSGVAPTLTAAGTDVLVFITDDAGSTWRGVLCMSDSK